MLVRKGWVESEGQRYTLVVTDRAFDFDGQHCAVWVHDIIVVEGTGDSPEDYRRCIERAARCLGLKIEHYGWEANLSY